MTDTIKADRVSRNKEAFDLACRQIDAARDALKTIKNEQGASYESIVEWSGDLRRIAWNLTKLRDYYCPPE